MLGPDARSRALVAAVVLLTALPAGAVLGPAGGRSTAHATAAALSPAVRYGPHLPQPDRPALLPAPRGVVLAPSRPSGLLRPPPRPDELAPVGPLSGPRAATRSRVVGPAGVVGPGSPPAQVRAVQRLLNARGAQLRVDGDWGPATTRAVQQVQARAGLPVDGRVGPVTAAALKGSAGQGI